ncbi:MAG: acyl-ACP--UDP-N-acetylglucosamine O-acyltransferase [Prevotella sp.]|uniref:acyl-ACP--UDP-N-acetylglucosamine O-acyltransferase n=1 Tax=Prevotella sp. TaxID=59823 RepID=UPI002A32BB90|nr:acyl-ACP--UDP-N-acetylglucosamine O-acyltransferase [Prevotella sp.]MDD7317941.1 acyl-ACP--UDP-N-acetylglucosamine O-acyltransferase [Prevotellaceae bacterium]MDY4020832.1 acyl-ACP--UDP-N-acetylglucosamine O-acyltransferase [Prevotella sp.]
MISDKAVISPNAKIGSGVTIYPFAYIEDDVVIGDGCVIYPFVSLMQGTTLGKDNKVHQGTVIGAVPQDFNFRGDVTRVEIGDGNIIRENVVINRATQSDGVTKIGNGNFIMEGVHISHDAKVGNECVLGYGTKIAGDTEFQSGVILSSNVIVNPKVRVGKAAMVSSGCRISRDVPPCIVVSGSPVKYCGLNTHVLTKYGVDEKVQKHIANAYRLIFHGQTSLHDALAQVEEQVPDGEEVRNIIAFIRDTTLGIINKM